MKGPKENKMVVRVQFSNDPERAEAALEILRQGFRRGLLKEATAHRKRNLVKDCEI